MTNFEYIKNMDIVAFSALIAKIKARAVEEALQKVGICFKVSSSSLSKTSIEIYEYLMQERDINA